ncbi:MAG: hypothetical protein ABSD68_00050 [Candidatus Micrarchaeales archaeon]|jgi:hypothetical protein
MKKENTVTMPKFVWVFIIALYVIVGFLYAAGNSVTPTGTVTVPNSCTFGGSPSTLSFGSISAGTNIGTTVLLTVTNNGNIDSNILVYGGNWVGQTTTTANFMVGNTVWNPTTGLAWASANKLDYAPSVDTQIAVTAGGGTGSIYFGLAIPAYTTPQNYNQIITISSSC